ncbi:polyketide synthase [Penicillium verhagenii]|nr:polyketide synthase [Penicillium verhagenii]
MGDINHTLPDDSGDIAIIGLACRFPGSASNSEKFWELLSNKKSAAGTVPETRYNVDAFHHTASEKLNTLSAQNGHFIDQDVAAFDAPFFNITSQEATAMDPTARFLLEVTYEAMETAGLPLEGLAGSDTSCHVGCFTRDYHEMLMRDAETAPLYAGTGTGFSLLSNRISWFFDLRGASMTLDTACSSSLVGLHLACQGLRTGEATTAIVCGANLILSPDLGMWLGNLRMTSTDGLSRSFAEGVTGYGRGEGIATVILKRMSDALRDGDPIRAVIRGTGVNQDGHTTGITVPNSEAQADLIRSTYLHAGLDVGQTAYFEAHGTGTAVGDPLELGAVAQAISAMRDSDDPLYVGSVKSNIGHLEGAAGLAGVIKCVLMFENGAIAPNIHFETPSRRIPFGDWHIAVPTEVTPWPLHKPKRASVNSFGYGGTNAHVILDHAAEAMASRGQSHLEDEVDHDVDPRLFVLSAPAESALERMMDRGREFLQAEAVEKSQIPLHQLAFTLSDRRSKFSWKAATVACSADELAGNWSTGNKQQQQLIHTPQRARLGFVFTGQGAQYARMGIELGKYSVFRESVQAADHYLSAQLHSEWSIVAEWEANGTASQVNRAHLSQPLCTVLQVALVDLLRSWNITPAVVVGHSSGEIAAAYSSGALSREDAWTVAYCRGKVCETLSSDPLHIPGAMLAVGLSASATEEYIRTVQTGTVVVACVNSPASVTVSGDATGIDELLEMLEHAKVFCRKLKVDLAYHSHHMQCVADTYAELLADIRPITTATQVQMISSVTGKPIKPEQLGSSYWVQNLVSPVLFTNAVSTLLLDDPSRRRRRHRAGEAAVDLLLEIGPHSALRGPLRQILQQHEMTSVSYASVLQRGENAIKSAIQSAGELYTRGVPVSIRAVNRVTTAPKPLTNWPSYPWDHSRRYWAESRLSRNYRMRRFGRHDLLGAPAADASATQPRWRNILRVQEQPWLRDHAVDGRLLFPAAGSLAMVIEAVRQLSIQGRAVASIHIEQVRITKAIIVPEDPTGVETVLQLLKDDGNGSNNKGQEDCWQFFVMTCSDGLKLEQNSSGRVRVRYTTTTEYTSENETSGKQILWQKAREASEAVINECSRTIEPADFYQATKTAGLQYGPLFQGLTQISAGQDCCTAVVQVTDTKASMPASAQSQHLVHPTTLDVIFHSLFAAIGGDHFDMQEAAVPIALDSLIIYPGLPSAAGTKLSTYCRTNRKGLRDLVADIVVTDQVACEEPRMIIKGLKCRKLTGTGETASSPLTKAPVGTLMWKPDLAFLDGPKLQRCVEGRLAQDTTSDLGDIIATVVDMAAHKNPDLAILQIGYSETLVESLLSILGTADGRTIRCSSYTLLDPKAKELAQSNDVLSKWQGVLSTDCLDDHVETWTEKSVDMAIVYHDCLSDEQFIRLKRCIRPDGLLIMQKHPGREINLNGHGEAVSEAWSSFDNLFPSSWCIGRRNHETLISVDQTVTLIESINPSPREIEISHQLSAQLNAKGLRTDTVRWPIDLVALQGKPLVSLLELHSKFLQDISAEDYDTLKTLTLNSTRVLWVAMGQDPGMQAAVGYLRVLQNENVNLDLRYLLLEDGQAIIGSPEGASQTIAALALAPTTDREYIEFAGSLHINRWVDDNRLDSIMTGDGSSPESDFMRLGDSRGPLRLCGSRYEAFDHNSMLANEEVEVQLMAFEFDGQSDASALGFSGIIAQVGSSCSRLRLGDKIWGYVSVDGPRTHLRLSESLCQLLPESGSFEQAASWAIGLGGAYTSLIDIAQLKSGQSVFIQDAASVVGQFSVQLAQVHAAIVLVSVNTVEERHQMEALGVIPTHILDNDDPDLTIAISRICSGKGLDVILHQSKDRKSLPCLWDSKEASDQNGNEPALSVAPFRRGATYSVFSTGHMLRTDPSRAAEILSRVSQLKLFGCFIQPSSVRVFPASEIGNTTQRERAESNPSSVCAIYTFNPDDRIPVTPETANPLVLNQEATYLLVGGTGGLGANLATFLANKGARHLAVVSRSGSSAASAKSAAQQLATMGVQVRFYAADVSDEAAMRQVLERCAADMPPIRGVVQCAAVLEDSIYQNMTHEQWRAATRPKIHGSIILHQLLLSHELQFFVMLSSIAGVVGNRSQANYAAGNTVQDALAHYRRGLGLPAVSVDLGLMLGIGLIAERGGATNLKKWEAVGIREMEFHALLTAAMTGYWSGSPVPTQLISGLPTGGILEAERLDRPFYFDNPRFAYLRKKDLDQSKIGKDGDQSSNGVTLVSQLASVQSLREGADLIVEALKHRLARELQTAVENIDANQPLHSYGVDSLLAVEIRTWILVNLQAELSLFDVLGGGSIHVLGSRVAAASKAIPVGLH